MAKLDTAQVRISSLEKSLAASEAEQQRAQDQLSDLLAEHDKLKAQLAAQKLETSEKAKEVLIQCMSTCACLYAACLQSVSMPAAAV